MSSPYLQKLSPLKKRPQRCKPASRTPYKRLPKLNSPTHQPLLLSLPSTSHPRSGGPGNILPTSTGKLHHANTRVNAYDQLLEHVCEYCRRHCLCDDGESSILSLAKRLMKQHLNICVNPSGGSLAHHVRLTDHRQISGDDASVTVAAAIGGGLAVPEASVRNMWEALDVRFGTNVAPVMCTVNEVERAAADKARGQYQLIPRQTGCAMERSLWTGRTVAAVHAAAVDEAAASAAAARLGPVAAQLRLQARGQSDDANASCSVIGPQQRRRGRRPRRRRRETSGECGGGADRKNGEHSCVHRNAPVCDIESAPADRAAIAMLYHVFGISGVQPTHVVALRVLQNRIVRNRRRYTAQRIRKVTIIQRWERGRQRRQQRKRAWRRARARLRQVFRREARRRLNSYSTRVQALWRATQGRLRALAALRTSHRRIVDRFRQEAAQLLEADASPECVRSICASAIALRHSHCSNGTGKGIFPMIRPVKHVPLAAPVCFTLYELRSHEPWDGMLPFATVSFARLCVEMLNGSSRSSILTRVAQLRAIIAAGNGDLSGTQTLTLTAYFRGLKAVVEGYVPKGDFRDEFEGKHPVPIDDALAPGLCFAPLVLDGAIAAGLMLSKEAVLELLRHVTVAGLSNTTVPVQTPLPPPQLALTKRCVVDDVAGVLFYEEGLAQKRLEMANAAARDLENRRQRNALWPEKRRAARAAARALRWGDDSRLFRVHGANTDPAYGEAEERLFLREEHTLWTEEAESALARAAAEAEAIAERELKCSEWRKGLNPTEVQEAELMGVEDELSRLAAVYHQMRSAGREWAGDEVQGWRESNWEDGHTNERLLREHFNNAGIKIWR